MEETMQQKWHWYLGWRLQASDEKDEWISVVRHLFLLHNKLQLSLWREFPKFYWRRTHFDLLQFPVERKSTATMKIK